MAVTTEIGTSMGFGSYITGLHLGDRLEMIVLDEAYKLVTDPSYWPNNTIPQK